MREDEAGSEEIDGPAAIDVRRLAILWRRARAGVQRYSLIAVLERRNASERLLRQLLGWPELSIDHHNPRCVGVIPPEDRPTEQQRAEVAELLREEVKFYRELVLLLERRAEGKRR